MAPSHDSQDRHEGKRDSRNYGRRSPSPYSSVQSRHLDGPVDEHGGDRAGRQTRDETRHRRRSRSRSPSRSPRRRVRRDEDHDEDARPPKRQRRHSMSPSQHIRKRESPEDVRGSRRDRSRSRSPYQGRDHEKRRSRHESSRNRSPRRISRRRESRSYSRRRRRDDSQDPHERPRPKRHTSQSPTTHKHRSRRHHHESHHKSPSPLPPPVRSKAPLPSQQDAFTNETAVTKPDGPSRQKPNYASTGLLAAETNTVTTGSTAIVLKYHEPPEARLPPGSAAWRLYIFKGKDLLETLELHTRSCWLFGRERAVVDVPVEHPSASKQHAVVQFRYVEKKDEWGQKKKGGVKPYVLDLDSANGTMVNGEKAEGRRYVELKSGDVVGFGESSREYVLLLPPK